MSCFRHATGRRAARALQALGLALLAAAPRWAHAAPPQVWFAPMDWIVRPQAGYGGSADYMTLFRGQGDAVLSRVAVFQIFDPFLSWGRGEDLKSIFAELKRRHIALALEGGIITQTERCGRGVEGYGGNGTVGLVRRIGQLGGDLAYLAMDEPLAGAAKCHQDYSEAARSIANNIAAIRAVFPGVRVGDVEALGRTPEAAIKWLAALRAATGEPLAFFHADVAWTTPIWRESVERTGASIRARGIPFGIIYNGSKSARTDQEWIAQAKTHIAAVEADPRIVLDHVVFESWQAQPSHIFPANDSGTFSHLLSWYFARRPR